MVTTGFLILLWQRYATRVTTAGARQPVQIDTEEIR
jgi:hypothetical protein